MGSREELIASKEKNWRPSQVHMEPIFYNLIRKPGRNLTYWIYLTYQHDLLSMHQSILRFDVTVKASCVWQGVQTAN